MTTAELIAGYAGPLFIVMSAAMLFNRAALLDAIRGLAKSHGLILFAGVMTLLAGLAIVRAHNVWAADWTVIVTLLGWLCIVGGIARIVWPDKIAEFSETVLESETQFTVWAAVAALIGVFLTLKGYALI